MALLADNLYIIVQYSKDEFVGKPSYSQTILSFLRIYHFVKNINLLCIDCCANNKILNILNEEKFKNENNSILEEKMDNSLKFGQTNSDILISSLMKILCKINKRANEDAQNQIILFTETDFSNFSYFARCKMTSCFQTAIELKNAKIDIVLFPNRNNVLEVPRYVKEVFKNKKGN
ncbi:hypothetical protein MHBO_000652 [Bonamia ostreae]|uniref:Uncharacterized protein n=1 Tax=Bonamia ostreae TaxID=126728 RepID=A0ABV2AGE4_9EUKA